MKIAKAKKQWIQRGESHYYVKYRTKATKKYSL